MAELQTQSLYSVWLACLCLLIAETSLAEAYMIGVGIADITGPPVEVTFMGYGKSEQQGIGIHLRQFSRAFLIVDGDQRFVFVTAEIGMAGHNVRLEVLKELEKSYGNLYNTQNFMLSGTHTHSTPGGYLQYLLFDVSCLGFIRETFDAMVRGITQSVKQAHESLTEGKVFVASGEVLDASINRSPSSYNLNPEAERLKYAHNVDKQIVQFSFIRSDDVPIGIFNWFAVHPTSMNETNRMVSSDNLGYAALLLEQKMNPNSLIGKGPFVGGFGSSNLGDVSPNIQGPHCQMSGLPCDYLTSTCPEQDKCIASGPGVDMTDSTRIIGERIFQGAWDLWTSGTKREISGPLSVVHQFVDMPNYNVTYFDETKQTMIYGKGCSPAMGYSFAAGTTDGPGLIDFTQATLTTNVFWNVIRDHISQPPESVVECHYPKPVLLYTGGMTFPYEWHPKIVPTQLALIGDIAIACVPAEFTTMSGRRLRETIRKSLQLPSDSHVVLAGLCNAYSHYVTTPEEYSGQRYEGGSTIYGPHTLPIYQDVFHKLGQTIMQRSVIDPGPDPPQLLNDVLTLQQPVIFDYAGWMHQFGDVLLQPPSVVYPGDTVLVNFVSANPRNDLMNIDTYLTVERKEGRWWRVIATDANWETMFQWKRTSSILGTSELEVVWDVPLSVKYGEYRISHFGRIKQLFTGIIETYKGTSRTFRVQKPPT